VGPLFATYLVHRSFRSLRQIEGVAARIAHGDLSARILVTEPRTTEVGSLQRAINTMLTQNESSFAAQVVAQERMTRFVSDASHELRTPLAAIRGYGELYRMGGVPANKTGEVMGRIETESNRMGRLVDDLLQLARIDEGREMSMEPVNLTDLAAGALSDMMVLAPERDCGLIPLAPPDDAGEAAKVAAQQLHSWPGNSISGFDSNLLSVVGLVFGLGFVLSFGYWTTNFVEVQRAMASDSISSAQSTPIIGTFVKMFVPFLVIVPGMVAGVMVSEIQQLKADSGAGYQFNDAVLYLMRDLLPNGLLGLAITGLLASFMAGMAANISAFNTVWGVDIYQHYIKKNADDAHYLMVGKLSTLTASVVAILTAIIASSYSNLMDYLQTLFSMFNAPLFATFIIGMFWKRATPHAGWIGLISGTLGALGVNILIWTKHLVMPGQGGAFLAAGVAFTVDVVITVLVSMATKPKPDSELKGFVYALTPKSERTDPHLHELPWYRRPIPLGIIAGVLVIVLNSIFH